MQDVRQDAGGATGRTRLLTTRDVQDLIRVDRSTIYRMAESGRLPALKVGRQWRFPEDRLYQWLDYRAPQADGLAPPALDELLGPEALHAFTALVGELLGVMSVVTDMAGHPLTEVGNPCGLFSAAHRYPGVVERCVAGWRDMAGEPDLDPHWETTPLGFLCARTLVRVGDHLRGMVLAGGVAPAEWPPDGDTLSRLAGGLGLPTELLAAHTEAVHHLSPPEQDRVLRILPRVGALLSRLAGKGGWPAARPSPEVSASDEAARRSDQ